MKTLLGACVLAIGLLTGCSTPSLNALASEETVVTDDGIVGGWAPEAKEGDKEEPKDLYTITAGQDKTYEVKVTGDEGKSMTFSMQLVKLGEHQFIDLTVTSKDYAEIGERFGTTVIPVHNFWKVKRDGDTLEVWPMDDKYLEGALRSGTLKLDYAEAEREKDKHVVITSSTADLQAFFKKQAENKDLWDGHAGKLKRQPAKK